MLLLGETSISAHAVFGGAFVTIVMLRHVWSMLAGIIVYLLHLYCAGIMNQPRLYHSSPSIELQLRLVIYITQVPIGQQCAVCVCPYMAEFRSCDKLL
jgi:hypothetical protein